MREYFVAIIYYKDGFTYESRMFKDYETCKDVARIEMSKFEDAEYFVIEKRYFKKM